MAESSGSDDTPRALPASCGRPLAELCAARRLTPRMLARRARVSLLTISKIEAGRAVAGPALARRIAAELGVEPGAVAEFAREVLRTADRPVGRLPLRAVRAERLLTIRLRHAGVGR